MSGASVHTLRPGGLDDPDASRSAQVLLAYSAAASASAFRRSVWRQVAVVGAVGCLLAATTRLFPAGGLVRGLLVLALIAGGAAVWDWHATRALTRLLGGDDRLQDFGARL